MLCEGQGITIALKIQKQISFLTFYMGLDPPKTNPGMGFQNLGLDIPRMLEVEDLLANIAGRAEALDDLVRLDNLLARAESSDGESLD